MAKKAYQMTIRAGGLEHPLVYTSRDMRILQSEQLPEGERFMIAMDVWDNLTVAHGMDSDAWTTKSRNEALYFAKVLRGAVTSDKDLLSHDYAYRMPAAVSWRRSGRESVPVFERYGHVHAAPGALYLDLYTVDEEWRQTGFSERIDLRPLDQFALEGSARLRFKRVPAILVWPQALAALVDFLQSVNAEEIHVRHHYAR